MCVDHGLRPGLGYAMAERLAAEGCNIEMKGFGEKDEIGNRRRKLESAHGERAIHPGADITGSAIPIDGGWSAR